MSDDVQRYMMYYDDLVPDDKGTWIRLEDYEALRVRIEELDEDNSAMLELLSPKAGYFITDDQIDAAWVRTTENDWSDYVPGVIDALGDFGIIACEDCGGSGDSAPMASLKPEVCSSCHGHGWILDNAPRSVVK